MEGESSQDSWSNNNLALEGWTKTEKYDLLQALKIHGSCNVEAIQTCLSNKTEHQIKLAIDHYRKKAQKCPVVTKSKDKKREKAHIPNISHIPLASWAKLLTNSLKYEDLQTETATALRLIADFENIPLAKYTEDIDFRKLYHLMANAVEGKLLEEDHISAMVFERCVIDTALASKQFIRTSSLRLLIDNMDLSEREPLNFLPKSIEDSTLYTVLLLCSQRNYNPFYIPTEYLVPRKM